MGGSFRNIFKTTAHGIENCTGKKTNAPELLWLPASEQLDSPHPAADRLQDPDHADYTIDVFLLQKEVGEILDEKRDSLDSLNAMCGAIAKLDQKDRAKLEAVSYSQNLRMPVRSVVWLKIWISSTLFPASTLQKNMGNT